ncbi:hypothetical protein HRR83_008043 [Exophiala dermatitidis]|uniref:Uncharacterized protein n=2 Tax=Exophiala dermatitidis TaxID=5970 RepID=H6BTH7_EXODN|nr:uncharacterized protein HMPREF1120_02544 [Exophiala dermatitidis NIH/UT8656]KAJ4504965.1 hypothetical protein HRR74_008793 [Exophiala dermatitidis]EHY54374.1 hypothetical protein HMPREF1120_02544 [Exophiala dermatitidis NIH/UT8656]KAJ4513473.1 hypothetical protein HRR73_005631 [Exophiala dermatitidis]KAJ4535752.1 hypothetical protein HRR77_007698 [Exophiala dermatitidis]KAJ4544612.1 hypothetical protein HRR76_002666 [Exophiala dermatitidis]
MLFSGIIRVLTALLWVCVLVGVVIAQDSTTSFSNGTTTARTSPTITGSSTPSSSEPPDVWLNVPNLSVGRIELDVDDLRADINLNAQVANLVTLNAGVAVSIQEVNLTIADVEAELELIVRLGHLVDIVNRVFESLDLNPLLISTINNVTNLLEPIVGAVDGLLGSITQGGSTVSFLIDNLGNIVQEVGGVSTIVGNYQTNMTDTGVSQTLSGGLVEKTYSYSPLNALVNIVFNAAGQVVQASVAKKSGGGGTATTPTSSPATSAAPTATSTQRSNHRGGH